MVRSISLGATRTFRIKLHKTMEVLDFPVVHGTQIIMAGTKQQFWKHKITKTMKPVGERIDLTVRQIEQPKSLSAVMCGFRKHRHSSPDDGDVQRTR